MRVRGSNVALRLSLRCILVAPNTIDAEVARFFAEADAQNQGIEIDDTTNKRLRWMIHKRVLVVMVVTYFAQTLDKG